MESTEACRSRLVDRLPLLFGMLATLVALAVLFVPSAIGVADNGDELRVACPLGLTPNLAPGQDVYFHSAALTYRRGPLNTGVNCDYRSTAAIPMRAGEVVSRLLPGRPALDLRVMGVFYAVLLGVALGGEAVHTLDLLGMAVILAGVVAISLAKNAVPGTGASKLAR